MFAAVLQRELVFPRRAVRPAPLKRSRGGCDGVGVALAAARNIRHSGVWRRRGREHTAAVASGLSMW